MNAALCVCDLFETKQLIEVLQKFYTGRERELKISCFFDVFALKKCRDIESFDIVFIGKAVQNGEAVSCLAKSSIVVNDTFDERDIFDILTCAEKCRRKTVTVRCGSTLIEIPLDQITFIESGYNVCTIHTVKNSSFITKYTLSHLEDILTDSFYRCHKSYIVNMDHIMSADTDFVMTTGERVLIRQKERRKIKDKFRVYKALRA